MKIINEIWTPRAVAEKAFEEMRGYDADLEIFGGCLKDCFPASADDVETAVIIIDDGHPVAECVRSVIVRHELDAALGL